jgi:uncharacterized protein (DUF2344 family)
MSSNSISCEQLIDKIKEKFPEIVKESFEKVKEDLEKINKCFNNSNSSLLKIYNDDKKFEIVNNYLQDYSLKIVNTNEEKIIKLIFPYKIGVTEVEIKFNIIPDKKSHIIDFSLKYSEDHSQKKNFILFENFPANNIGFDSKKNFDKTCCQPKKDIFEWIDILLQHFFRNQYKELELNKS